MENASLAGLTIVITEVPNRLIIQNSIMIRSIANKWIKNNSKNNFEALKNGYEPDSNMLHQFLTVSEFQFRLNGANSTIYKTLRLALPNATTYQRRWTQVR